MVCLPLRWCCVQGVAQYPVFALNTLLFLQALQNSQLGFLVSLYVFSIILPQLSMHAVIFSPVLYLYILCCLRRGVDRCKHCSKGSQVPGLSQHDAISLTAAAKSLQSCPTLCDPIDGSLPGSSVHGIFQARTLEWVAISFSNAGK